MFLSYGEIFVSDFRAHLDATMNPPQSSPTLAHRLWIEPQVLLWYGCAPPESG